MPNWVVNTVTGPPEIKDHLVRTANKREQRERDEREAEKEQWARRGGHTDFVAQPMDMDKEFVSFDILIPEPYNIERDGCSGQHGPGVVCWYNWNKINWGTKWNACESSVTNNEDGTITIRFETAWSHPIPVIKALADALPDAELVIEFADENIGYNVGSYSVIDGDLTFLEFDEGTPEACDFASRLFYGKSYDELIAESE